MVIKFKRLEDVLKPRYYKEFEKFMIGQIVDENGIYERDFVKWLNKEGWWN